MELNRFSLTADILGAPLISVCWLISDMHPGSEWGRFKTCNLSQKNGGGGSELERSD